MSAPPEANFAVREAEAFMKGAQFGEWRAVLSAKSDTRAWRLAQLATTLMTAEVSAGARNFDGTFWMDRATEIMAEAERRVAAQDGVAP